MGLTPLEVGNADASATYRSLTSQVSPVGLIAPDLGELPMRQVPI